MLSAALINPLLSPMSLLFLLTRLIRSRMLVTILLLAFSGMSDCFDEISNESGELRVKVCRRGAAIQAVIFTDANGTERDLVLGYDTDKEYDADPFYMGATVGRVANRIKSARFTLYGQGVSLPANNGPHHLHGGPRGLSMLDWEVTRHLPESITYKVVADPSDGYPGQLIAHTTYVVNSLNQLVVEHGFEVTERGPVSLACHAYWNLDGARSIGAHWLRVAADEYLPVDGDAMATGERRRVKGTSFDFNAGKELSMLGSERQIDLDNDYLLNDHATHDPVLTLRSPVSGIQLDVSTSLPCIHIYSGLHLSARGKNGSEYSACAGLAIEAQHHSAAVNYEQFPSIIRDPGQVYRQETVFSLSNHP